jgi:hypothetical protein
MWLMSVPFALSLVGAVAGAVLLRVLVGIPPGLALLVGGIAGWLVVGIALAPVAERLDRSLHRMGGPRRRR